LGSLRRRRDAPPYLSPTPYPNRPGVLNQAPLVLGAEQMGEGSRARQRPLQKHVRYGPFENKGAASRSRSPNSYEFGYKGTMILGESDLGEISVRFYEGGYTASERLRSDSHVSDDSFLPRERTNPL